MNISADSFLTSIRDQQYTYSYQKKKTVYKTDEEIKKIRGNAKSLKKSINQLSSYQKGVTDKERMQKRVQNYLDEYNELVNNKEVVPDKTYQKSIKRLKELMEDNKYKLSDVGITYDTKDKKYVLDKDKFADASGRKIEKLFSDDDGVMKEALKLTNKIYKTLQENSTQVQVNNIPVQLNSKEYYLGVSAANATTCISSLNAILKYGKMNSEMSDITNQCLGIYADQYNLTLAMSEEKEEKDAWPLFVLHQDNQEKLNDIGFEITDGVLQYQEKDWTQDEAPLEQLRNLFGENADFGKSAYQYFGNIFKTALKTENTGIIIDDYA